MELRNLLNSGGDDHRLQQAQQRIDEPQLMNNRTNPWPPVGATSLPSLSAMPTTNSPFTNATGPSSASFVNQQTAGMFPVSAPPPASSTLPNASVQDLNAWKQAPNVTTIKQQFPATPTNPAYMVAMQQQQQQSPPHASTSTVPTGPQSESVIAALKAVERFRTGGLPNEVVVRRGGRDSANNINNTTNNGAPNSSSNTSSSASIAPSTTTTSTSSTTTTTTTSVTNTGAPSSSTNNTAAANGVNNDTNNDISSYPELFTQNAYEGAGRDWEALWKPELLDKQHIDLYMIEQRTGLDSKRTTQQFREMIASSPAHEVRIVKDIGLMHTAQCLTSKKNKHCLGCSSYWRSVQLIQDELRPWGPNDLLRFEPSHSETFLGTITMNGSYVPLTSEMMGTDLISTLFYSDDSQTAIIWGFLPPWESHKTVEEDQPTTAAPVLLEDKSFAELSVLEKKAKIVYGIQRVGQTMVVPAGWRYFTVTCGAGISLSASWNILRVKNVALARQQFELNRTVGVYRPIDLNSMIVCACFQALDDLEQTTSKSERRQLIALLLVMLPVLKTQVLEDVLGDRLSLSSFIVLAYHAIVERVQLKYKLSPSQRSEISQLTNGRSPLLSLGVKRGNVILSATTTNTNNINANSTSTAAAAASSSSAMEVDNNNNSNGVAIKREPDTNGASDSTNAVDLAGAQAPINPKQLAEPEVPFNDDDSVMLNWQLQNDTSDERFSCVVCRTILYNTRRSCAQCQNYDLCVHCYRHDRHQHSLNLIRRTDVNTLVQFVHQIQTTVNAFDEQLPVLMPPPPFPMLNSNVSVLSLAARNNAAALKANLPPTMATAINSSMPSSSSSASGAGVMATAVPVSSVDYLQQQQQQQQLQQQQQQYQQQQAALLKNAYGGVGGGGGAGIGPLSQVSNVAGISSLYNPSGIGGMSRKRTRSRETQTNAAAMQDDDSDSEETLSAATRAAMPGQYQQDNYGDDEVINCICGNNKDLGFMISCERCRAWLHGKCVGISKRNEPDEYYCPNCVKKSGGSLSNTAKLKRSIDKIQL